MSAYLFRIARADAALLRTAVRDVVGFPCRSFGGAAAWDFVPDKGRANLRPLTVVHQAAELVVAGDFGHAFASSAEVRWKRLDQDQYDVLILSDEQPNLAAAQPIGPNGGAWATSVPSEPKRMAIIQSGGRERINVIAYHAPNGAVQLLRYQLEVQR